MPTQNHPAKTSALKGIPGFRPDWRLLALGAVLATAAIVVYGGTFHVPMLFDDLGSIADNLTIRHWRTAFFPAVDSTVCGRPVLNLTLALNYAISGQAVWSYHALNLAIHIAAGLTLFGIVRRTLAPRVGPQAVSIAFAAALLWTLHPLQTESVTYIVQRAESLMGLFYLLTLYCFIRGAEGDGQSREQFSRLTEKQAGKLRRNGEGKPAQLPADLESRGQPEVAHHRLWFVLCAAACLVGAATKEVMVSAPLIVLLYDRTFIAGSFQAAWRRRRGLYLALSASWVLLAVLVAGAGWNRNGSFGLKVGVTPLEYWQTQFGAVARYLRLSAWPHPLVFDYGPRVVERSADVWPQAVLLGMLFVGTVIALRRWPAWGFAGAWFFAILAPTCVMPGASQTMAEHRMYLSLAVVTTLAALGISALARRRGWIVFTALALGLGLLTARRNEDYCSVMTLWKDTAAKRPRNERAHNNLGFVLSQMPGRLDDAIAEYEEALRLDPDLAEGHLNLGKAWARIPGRLGDAIAEYEEALRLDPDLPEAHFNLGNAWAQIPGRLNDAVAEHEKALRLDPGSAAGHNNLGNALAQMPGRLNDAIAEFEEALRLDPEAPEAHGNLGITLSKVPGRLDDAVAQYEEALRLKPDAPEVHFNLGCALSMIPGRLSDAIAQYEEAQRLRPDYAPGWHALGVSRYRSGDMQAAAAAFREELRLSPDDPLARQALMAALQQSAGR